MTEIITAIYNRSKELFGTLDIKIGVTAYEVPNQPITSVYNAGAVMLVESATGIIKLLTSEIVTAAYPGVKDELQIKVNETTSAGSVDEWQDFTILAVTPQNNGATLLIQYGAKYGS